MAPSVLPSDIELINVYVPEAADFDLEAAARLAQERDQAAATQLDWDTEHRSGLNLEAAVKAAKMELVS